MLLFNIWNGFVIATGHILAYLIGGFIVSSLIFATIYRFKETIEKYAKSEN